MQVRLTGPVPLVDEEFATLTDRVYLMTAAMMGGVLLTLWLALRSFKIIFAILTTLFVGLAITMGAGLWFVGVFNIISIAFIALFVGLGVDFGIQFAVRYRHERHLEGELAVALPRTRAGRRHSAGAGGGGHRRRLFLVPAHHLHRRRRAGQGGRHRHDRGVSSVHHHAAGDVACCSIRRARHEDIGFTSLGRVDDFMTKHRKRVIQIAGAAGVISLGLMAFVQFDSNPLNLRSPKVESVSTLLDLMKNPQTSPNTIDVPAFSLLAADELRDRIAQGSLVAQAITLSSFVPDQQAEKVALIADANSLLDATINPFEIAPRPATAEIVTSFQAHGAETARRRRQCPGQAPRKPLVRSAGALDAVGEGRPRRPRAGGRSWSRASNHAGPGFGFAEGRALHRRDHTRRHPLGLGGQGRHRACSGFAQGHQQRSGGVVGLLGPGAADRAAGHRRAHLHPRDPARPSWAPSPKRAFCPSLSSPFCWRWCCAACMTC